MSARPSSLRLKAAGIAGLIFGLGVAAGAIGERTLGQRAEARAPVAPLTVRAMAQALRLDPSERARVAALLDSLRPELARAADDGADSLRVVTRRARGRLIAALPPERRAEFERWMDVHHRRMMETMHELGPGMTGPGMMRGGGMGRGMMGGAPTVPDTAGAPLPERRPRRP